MKRKYLSFILSVFVATFLAFTLCTSVSAASGDVTKTGVMQDTSVPDGGVIYWAYTYNKSTGKASLKITGNGYMPNGTDQDWFTVQSEAGCYIYSVTVGEGVKSIMSGAFAGEIYLSEITLPSTLERIGSDAFSGTALKTLNIPKKVTYVDGTMFADSSITQFNVSSDNPVYKSYGGNIYSKDMTSLVVAAPGKFSNSNYVFNIPKSVKTIEKYAFYSTDITSVTIPSNVTTVKGWAFSRCSSLSKVVLENGVQSIYDSAFLGCGALKEIHLPKSITYLGWYSFGYRYAVAYDDLADVLESAGINHPTLNSANYEYYAELAGYDGDAFVYCKADKTFSVYAPKDSVGEKYASKNSLKYVKSSYFLNASNTYTGVSLTWSYSDSVLAYKLYRKSADGKLSFIDNIDGSVTSYIDTSPYKNADNTYVLEVIYYTDSKNTDTGGITVHYVPAPVLKTAGNTVDGIRLNWEPQSGAKYQYIYKKEAGEKSWHYICCVNGTTSYYIDKNVKNNQKYTYTVRGNDGVGTSSFYSPGRSYTFVKNPSFSVCNKINNVTVSWNAAGKTDFYNVYRKTSTTQWKCIAKVDGSKTSFADTTAVKGVTYIYTVRSSYNGCLSGYDYSGTTYKCLEAPSGITLSNRVSGVMVTWKKSAGAQRYNVYRRVSGGSWTRIATVNGANTTSYLDKTAKNSVTYTYTVMGADGSYYSGYNYTGVTIKFISTPKITSAVSCKDGIHLKFNQVNGCAGYYIYRKTPNGNWSRVGKTNGYKSNSFIDKTAKKGQTYIYTVRAYNGKYISSFYSNTKSIKDVY